MKIFITFLTLYFVPLLSAASYTHPGIVGFDKEQLIGSDHLLNLGTPIAIVVEILKPEGATFPFEQKDVEEMIFKKFKAKGLTEGTFPKGAELPLFNMLLVIYPIDQGYVALADGRLFESIDPKRVKLDKETQFQAITWEKKTLVVAPKDDFVPLLMKTVADIADTFIERYEYFSKIGEKKTF